MVFSDVHEQLVNKFPHQLSWHVDSSDELRYHLRETSETCQHYTDNLPTIAQGGVTFDEMGQTSTHLQPIVDWNLVDAFHEGLVDVG